MLTFYTEYFKFGLKCSQYILKTFQDEIIFLIVNFDTFKGFLILAEFGKLGKFS